MPRYSPEQYHEAAKRVWLDVLRVEHAVTMNEIEARAADRTWNPQVWSTPIDPHHFTNARKELHAAGLIESAAEPTTSHPAPIMTWSLVPRYGLKTKIANAAARKRLLTARHAGWSKRGGARIGLVGRAGENALMAALHSAESRLTQASGSVTSVLDVNLMRWGEVDACAYYVDVSNPQSGPVAITVMFEVKNTRDWYYADDDAVLRFLGKAAVVQAERPDVRVLPVFLARKVQFTLWEQGERDGFLPVWVNHQMVLSDFELTQDAFNEVTVELGYADMILVDKSTATTNYHTGIVSKAVPARARTYAERWSAAHRRYLPGGYQPR